MRVRVNGRPIDLGKNAFVGQGGEGSVYAKNSLAYKVYSDPSKMIPLAKIQELSALDRDNILGPINVITSSRKPVGYTMPFVRRTFPLCQMFTKAFRTRHGVQHSDVLSLVLKMRDTILHVHGKGILIVDLNEMNFLVSKNFSTPYFIDVDSYQTPSFPATALMESVRDRHCGGKFTEGSDWFSFAVVSFQMFVGIHPYKGKHPSIKDMDERMRTNVSVLDKDVRIPKACQDLSVIPPAFRAWYEIVLGKGERTPPPASASATTVSIVIARVTGSDNFVITKINDYDDTIVEYLSVGRAALALVDNPRRLHDGRRYAPVTWDKLNIGVSPRSKDLIQGWTEGGKLRLHNITRGLGVPVDIDAEEIMSHDGVLYVKNGGNLMEIELPEVGARVSPAPRLVATVMEKATQLFPGVVMENVLGSQFAFLLPRAGACYQVRMREIEGHRLVDAKLDKNVMVVIGYRRGKYDRFIFRFDDEFSEYDVKRAKDVPYSGINFVSLDTGVCVILNENEEIGMFSSKKDAKTFKIIDDPAIDGGMTLCKDGAKVLFYKDNALYKVEVRQS